MKITRKTADLATEKWISKSLRRARRQRSGARSLRRSHTLALSLIL